MYARGLSVRDIEAAFVDESGRCVLSKSAVSVVTERLWADYQAFAGRDLSEHAVVYLFVDGIAERLHLGQPREAVLAAWGITQRGDKVLLGLLPGTKEDTPSCKEFLRDLIYACRSPIDAQSVPRISWSNCSARSAAEPRLFRMPSVNGRS